MIDELFINLDEKDVKYDRNIPISRISSVKIGAEAEVIVHPSTIDELIFVLSLCERLKIKYKTVGNMTNLLPTDTPFCGVLISTVALNRFEITDNVIRCECGCSFSSLILRLARLGLGGAEPLFGIPGTVGGMLYQNAGAFGVEISDYVISALVYSPKRATTIRLSRDEMSFSYRRSRFSSEELIILEASFIFIEKDCDRILSDVKKIREKRNASQPHTLPSLGSVFKRVGGTSAAYYIDKAGLKGYSINGAAVSEKHAGFIVNIGGARSADFLALVEHIKSVVFSKFGIELECEIEILQ